MKKKFLLAVFAAASSVLLFGATASAATWVDRYTSGIRNWVTIAASSDGSRLAAGDTTGLAYIYTSSDSGATWTARMSAGARAWSGIASSSDGMKLAAVASGSAVYTSTDGGSTWTTRTVSGASSLQSIASSSDGMKLAVANGGGSVGTIYTSTDGGATWTERSTAGARTWNFIASSADGMRLSAVTKSNTVHTSADGGATWTSRTITSAHASNGFFNIASSASGLKLAVGDYSLGYIYTSTDGGLTWTQRVSSGPRNWLGISYSGDGTDLAATDHFGYIYTSANDGVTWTQETGAGSRDWDTIVHSYDGSFMAAGPLVGDIWTTGASTTGITVPPVVVTDPATSITATNAVMRGTLVSTGSTLPVGLYFNYGTTPLYGLGTGIISVTAPTTFSDSPSTPLTCGTLYYYRAFALVPSGSSYGADRTFTTLPCAIPPALPVVTTVSATAVTDTSVTFNGNISSLSPNATTIGFWYSPTVTTTTGSDPSVTQSGTGAFGAPGPYSRTLTGLTCGTTYNFRFWATNTAGTGYGLNIPFTTLACPATLPVVVTDPVTAGSVTASFATMNGTLLNTGSALPVSEGFNYGTTPSYGLSTTVAAALVTGPFSGGPASALVCGTLYHYQAFATTSAGTSLGADRTFTTLPCPISAPTVVTNAPVSGSITTSSATLSGTVVSMGSGATSITNRTFTSTTGLVTPSTAIVSLVPSTFTFPVTGLSCATTYSYTASATNSGSMTGSGSSVSFTTLPCPASPPTVVTNAPVAGSITASGATLSGTVTSIGIGATSITNRSFAGTFGSTASITGTITSMPNTFTYTVSGLACGAFYSYTASATNNGSATGSGSSVGFNTLACPAGAPTVVTNTPTSVTSTSAVLSGSVTAFGTGATTITNRTFTSSTGSVTPSTFTVTSLPSTFTFLASGLWCNTTYTYTARATNGGGVTGSGSPVTFTTLACPLSASITTVSSGSVLTTSAVLTGNITSLGSGGSATDRGFLYGTVPTSSSSLFTTQSGTWSTGTYSHSVTGLAPCTLYYFKAYMSQGGGITFAPTDLTFTTTCPPGLPTVVTDPVGTVTTSSAVINGRITGLGGSGVTVTNGFTVSGGVMGSISPATTSSVGTVFSTTMSGLLCSTSYTYTARATNSAGTVSAPSSVTFTTLPCTVVSPVVTTNTPVVSGTNVTFSGVLTSAGTTSSGVSGGSLTSFTGFDYGVSPSGAPTTVNLGGSYAYGVGSPFTTTLSTLSCGTAYYVRAHGTNLAGSDSGSDMTFTIPCPVTTPSVITTAVGTTTTTTAVINGQITGLGGTGVIVTPGFAIPSGTILGTITPASVSSAGTSFSALLSGLSCNTSYTYTARATNSAGMVTAPSSVTFLTLPCNPVVATISGSISGTMATLTGDLLSLGAGATSATVGFHYGPTTAYGYTTTLISPRTTTGTFLRNMTMPGNPTCNNFWHLRAWAVNSNGVTVTGGDKTFCF